MNFELLKRFAIVGEELNRLKTIHAFMKREGIDFERTEEFLSITDDYIRSKYVIKGEVNWKTIQKAKKVGSEMSEHELQVQICQYLKENNIAYWANVNGFIHNGNKLETAKYINYLKQEGYKNGVFDLTILYGNAQVAFLELKTTKGKPSEHQLKMRDYLTKKGYKNKIAYGYNEAIDFINELL